MEECRGIIVRPVREERPVFEKESNQPHLYKNLFTGSTVCIHPVEDIGYTLFFVWSCCWIFLCLTFLWLNSTGVCTMCIRMGHHKMN